MSLLNESLLGRSDWSIEMCAKKIKKYFRENLFKKKTELEKMKKKRGLRTISRP